MKPKPPPSPAEIQSIRALWRGDPDASIAAVMDEFQRETGRKANRYLVYQLRPVRKG